jgi:predicted short-subunit dehydrogenase-like oxidoreductase (DUF2520 family)
MHREMKFKVQSSKSKVEKGKGEKGKRGRRTSLQPVSPFSRLPSSPSRRKPSVAVVGAGRLGTALARALAACDYEIEALVSRSASHARRAVRLAGVKARALSFESLEELPRAEVLFITTPDDALAEVVRRLTELKGEPARGGVALHTSGALASDVLAPLRERGYAVGSMHPLAAVSDAVGGAESLRRAFYCVEGDRRALSVARKIVRDLGGESFSVRASEKALYHASAVLTAGHTVALFDIALRLLARCGLSQSQARRVLLPLLRSTLDNLTRETTERALTGTFARGDGATVRKHLAALRDAGEPDALLAYALLGGRSLRLAVRRGADAKQLLGIARLLAEALGFE